MVEVRVVDSENAPWFLYLLATLTRVLDVDQHVPCMYWPCIVQPCIVQPFANPNPNSDLIQELPAGSSINPYDLRVYLRLESRLG